MGMRSADASSEDKVSHDYCTGLNSQHRKTDPHGKRKYLWQCLFVDGLVPHGCLVSAFEFEVPCDKVKLSRNLRSICMSFDVLALPRALIFSEF
jgi:hypothetical protein